MNNVSKELADDFNMTTGNFIPETNLNSSFSNPTVATRVQIPFIMVSSVMFLASFLLLLLHLIKPYKDIKRISKNDTSNKTITSNNSSNGSVNFYERTKRCIFKNAFTSSVLFLASTVFCFVVGSEMNVMNFTTSFVKAIGLGKLKGVDMNSAYLGSFTASRGINILLATKLSPAQILALSLTFLGVGNTIALIYGLSSEPVLWTSFVLIGYGFGGMFAATYSFVEENIRVSTKICGLFTFSASISSSINPLIIGKYLEDKPSVFLLYNFVSYAVYATSFGVLYVLMKAKRNHHPEKNPGKGTD